MPPVRPSDRLRSFFLPLVRKTFDQLGLGDQAIVQYVASILVDFSRTDQLLRVREADGRKLGSVVEAIAANLDPGERSKADTERALRKYVGDYTLFMSGLFRRFVERGGYLNYYLEEGARAYRAVSALDVVRYRPGFLLFEELSQHFENYAGALDFMRKCYFVPAPKEDPFGGFLKQIDGWVRYGISDN